MADFKISSKITGGNEGGYSFAPGDTGLETFAGVSRKFWPHWRGWAMIDVYKANHGTKGINSLLANPDMINDIDQFYKTNFWDVNKLDSIKDQQIANSVYDMGVNAGVATAAKMLQVAAKAMVDGVIGSGTIAAVNGGNALDIYNSINEQREAYYTHLATRPGQAQFLHSWLSRIKPYEKEKS
jgi:lysozyme family protein